VSWRSASFAVWGAIGLATLVLVALAATGRGGVLRHPFAPLRAYLAGHRLTRVVTVIAWMWLGWHFFAR
jgi:hypothetical protein